MPRATRRGAAHAHSKQVYQKMPFRASLALRDHSCVARAMLPRAYARSAWRLSTRRAARRLSSPSVGIVWPVVQRLNDTVERYPAHSFIAHISSSLATFGVAYTGLHAIGFEAPALAVAGILNRLTKKFRTPVDVTLAAALTHAVPSANALKLGPLLALPVQPSAGDMANTSKLEKWLLERLQWAQGPVNTYGGPYMLVHWLTGLSSVAVLTAGVHYGLDVTRILSALPFVSLSEASMQSASDTASCVAGAMCVNTLTLPVRLYALSIYGVPGFAAIEPAVERSQQDFLRLHRAFYRQQLRADPAKERRLLLVESSEPSEPKGAPPASQRRAPPVRQTGQPPVRHMSSGPSGRPPPPPASAAQSAYRNLLKAQRVLFAGDPAARAKARAETRMQFVEHANASPEEVPALVRDAHDAADFLRENVAQAVRNERGNYEIQPTADHIHVDQGPGDLHVPDLPGDAPRAECGSKSKKRPVKWVPDE